MRLTTHRSGMLCYAGISEDVLWTEAKNFFVHEAAVSERFCLFFPVFPAELAVNMSYVGVGNSLAGPQGFSLSEAEYHEQMSRDYPDLYAGENHLRNFDALGHFVGHDPVTVDEAWIRRFPQYAPFAGDRLCLWQIGGGSQAVAVPSSFFPRMSAALVRFEKDLGISERCAAYSAEVRRRCERGERYIPAAFEWEWLDKNSLECPAPTQQKINELMRDLNVVRILSERKSASQGEESDAVPQYAPFLYACDRFETVPADAAPEKLVQPVLRYDAPVRDFWLDYADVEPYLLRNGGRIDLNVLCEAFQLAPVPDGAGGRYPDYLRVVSVNKAEKPDFLCAETVNNPAYGGGLAPGGAPNRMYYLRNSAALLAGGRLAREQGLPAENNLVPPDRYAWMRRCAHRQECVGRMIDTLYFEETALFHMKAGTKEYGDACRLLDARMRELQEELDLLGEKTNQPSDYELDLAYMQKLSLYRSGEWTAPFREEDDRRESVRQGYAMRSLLHSVPANALFIRRLGEKPPETSLKGVMRLSGGDTLEWEQVTLEETMLSCEEMSAVPSRRRSAVKPRRHRSSAENPGEQTDLFWAIDVPEENE